MYIDIPFPDTCGACPFMHWSEWETPYCGVPRMGTKKISLTWCEKRHDDCPLIDIDVDRIKKICSQRLVMSKQDMQQRILELLKGGKELDKKE